MTMTARYFAQLALTLICCSALGLEASLAGGRQIQNFNRGWRFHLGDVPNGAQPSLADSSWRMLNVPHDWSIEGPFSKENPATPSGGALPGGIGWYRKSFTAPPGSKGKITTIEFDGVYRNSEVWLNGHYLGKRPYGYSSFAYDLTPHLLFGAKQNVLAVRVDNAQQPNSRWYSGSGMYRTVRLVTTETLCVDHWGTWISTPEVSQHSCKASLQVTVKNAGNRERQCTITTTILDPHKKPLTKVRSSCVVPAGAALPVSQAMTLNDPVLWSPDSPQLYEAVTTIQQDGRPCDEYRTPFGIRTFKFDAATGFSLNGVPMKIKGVCNHHDLGCLGAAVSVRALERQLEILKSMGCNAIRTSHNPPAPELLDLCDRMGFLVMDEAFDMWKKEKTRFDYSLEWDAWHKRDLEDMILRDRNHPSIILWSIGNEVAEQWSSKDTNAARIARELAAIVRALDMTRPVLANCNNTSPDNPIFTGGGLDLVGFSYGQATYKDFPVNFPGKTLIASEAVSAIASRGSYDMPSDSIRRWPSRWDLPLVGGNADNSCSSYDNCSVPWGSTQEETWRLVKKLDFLPGFFIWTGFDYLGEPTPYEWPSRSSYFGILDLAGFPKDSYYLYQSEWTSTPVLHVFPHWNWRRGDSVDVWAYTSCTSVELFLNGVSMGVRSKTDSLMHCVWKLRYEPGTLKAIGHTPGRPDLIREVRTAEAAESLTMSADRTVLAADGSDLSFITVRIVDRNGTLIPDADADVQFSVEGEGRIAGVDNGLQTSLESFQANHRKAFHGMCLLVVRAGEHHGTMHISATAKGLKGSALDLTVK